MAGEALKRNGWGSSKFVEKAVARKN